MKIKSYLIIATTTLCSLFVTQAHADWALNPQNAIFTFVTTKAISKSEVQKFTKLSGGVSNNGAIDVMIDLTSVDTGIPIRDERMQSMLFEIAKYPKNARFTGQLPDGLIQAAKKNGVAEATIDGLLELHGAKQIQKISIKVFSEKQGLWVTTTQPILVSASNYGMDSGIEALKNIAGLPSISDVVSANFTLQFLPKP